VVEGITLELPFGPKTSTPQTPHHALTCLYANQAFHACHWQLDLGERAFTIDAVSTCSRPCRLRDITPISYTQCKLFHCHSTYRTALLEGLD